MRPGKTIDTNLVHLRPCQMIRYKPVPSSAHEDGHVPRARRQYARTRNPTRLPSPAKKNVSLSTPTMRKSTLSI